ncbi:hypothetical protein [Streptomyces sp. NPDC048191]|uniref:hypothetical protein n=1 Tax=Streptomyces sp. NPDC048191 TaxID=3155484 RepID=UPI0034035C4F
MLWPNPSERVCELIRHIAESQLPVPDEVADQLWRASQRETRQREYVDDPVLSEADRRLNKANMTHWLVSNLREPGRRVPPPKSSEMLIFARDLVLRGMDVNELGSWRAAQRVGWGLWVEQCFAATADRDELRELIEVSANSLTTYIDDSIAAVGTYVDEVRGEMGLGAQAQRHTTVQLLLQGARISRRRAEEQLGYPLAGHHVAAILWVDSPADVHKLERAAEYVMRMCGATRRLTLPPSTSALWLWALRTRLRRRPRFCTSWTRPLAYAWRSAGPEAVSRVSGRVIWMLPPHSAFWPGSDRRGRSSATRTCTSSTCSRPIWVRPSGS